jgi:hypothetical protein
MKIVRVEVNSEIILIVINPSNWYIWLQ